MLQTGNTKRNCQISAFLIVYNVDTILFLGFFMTKMIDSKLLVPKVSGYLSFNCHWNIVKYNNN